MNWSKFKYIQVETGIIYIDNTRSGIRSKQTSTIRKGFYTTENAPKELLEELKHRNNDGTRKT